MQCIVVIRQLVHAFYNRVGILTVLVCKFPDNSDTIYDGIAGTFYLIYSIHDTFKITLDRTGQCIIGGSNVFYRQNTAYITEGDRTDFQRQVIDITFGYCSLNVEYKSTQKQHSII